MKIINIAFLLLFFFLIQSCTPALWKKTNPDEYVQVSMKDFSENEIKAKNIKYYKNDKEKVYYIEKSNLRKFGDYSLRFLLTPITVPIDAVTLITVTIVLNHMPISKDDCEKDLSCLVDTFPPPGGQPPVVDIQSRVTP